MCQKKGRPENVIIQVGIH